MPGGCSSQRRPLATLTTPSVNLEQVDDKSYYYFTRMLQLRSMTFNNPFYERFYSLGNNLSDVDFRAAPSSKWPPDGSLELYLYPVKNRRGSDRLENHAFLADQHNRLEMVALFFHVCLKKDTTVSLFASCLSYRGYICLSPQHPEYALYISLKLSF